MLRTLLHRLTLTGVLMGGFFAAGLLFGNPVLEHNVAEKGVNGIEMATNVAESPRATQRARPDLGWPFFSFSKKRSTIAW